MTAVFIFADYQVLFKIGTLFAWVIEISYANDIFSKTKHIILSKNVPNIKWG